MSTQTRIADRPRAAAPHPLDPLSAAEYTAVVAALRARDTVHDRVRLSSIALREPAKRDLGAFETGERVPRQADAVLHDPTSGSVWEAIVDLTEGAATVRS